MPTEKQLRTESIPLNLPDPEDNADYSVPTLKEQSQFSWAPYGKEKDEWMLIPTKQISRKQLVLKPDDEYHDEYDQETFDPTGNTWVRKTSLAREVEDWKQRKAEQITAGAQAIAAYTPAVADFSATGALITAAQRNPKIAAYLAGKGLETSQDLSNEFNRRVLKKAELEATKFAGEYLPGIAEKPEQQKRIRKLETEILPPGPVVPQDSSILTILRSEGGEHGNELADKISKRGFQSLSEEENGDIQAFFREWKEQVKQVPPMGMDAMIEEIKEKKTFDLPYINKFKKSEYVGDPHDIIVSDESNVYTLKRSLLDTAREDPREYKLILQDTRRATELEREAKYRDRILGPAKYVNLSFFKEGVFDETSFKLDAFPAHVEQIMASEYPDFEYSNLGRQDPHSPKTEEQLDRELTLRNEVDKRATRATNINVHQIKMGGSGEAFALIDWEGSRKYLMEWHKTLGFSKKLEEAGYGLTEDQIREQIKNPTVRTLAELSRIGTNIQLDTLQGWVSIGLASMWPSTTRHYSTEARNFQKPHPMAYWTGTMPTSWYAGALRVQQSLGARHTLREILPKVEDPKRPGSIQQGKKIEAFTRMYLDGVRTMSGQTNDPEELKFMLDTMQQHEFLADVSADFYGDLARALDLDDDSIRDFRRFGAIAGWITEFVPGIGADPATMFIASSTKAWLKTAKIYKTWKNSEDRLGNLLENLTLPEQGKTFTQAHKILKNHSDTGRRIAPLIEKKATIEALGEPDIKLHLDDQAAQARLTENAQAEAGKELGGYHGPIGHHSPISLPGVHLMEPENVQEYVNKRFDYHVMEGGKTQEEARELAKTDFDEILVDIERDITARTIDGDVYTKNGIKYVRNGDIWEAHSKDALMSPIEPRQLIGARWVESPKVSQEIPTPKAGDDDVYWIEAKIEATQARLASEISQQNKVEHDLKVWREGHLAVAKEYTKLKADLNKARKQAKDIDIKIDQLAEDHRAVLDPHIQAKAQERILWEGINTKEVEILTDIEEAGAIKALNVILFNSLNRDERQRYIEAMLSEYDNYMRTPLKGTPFPSADLRNRISVGRRTLINMHGQTEKRSKIIRNAERENLTIAEKAEEAAQGAVVPLLRLMRLGNEKNQLSQLAKHAEARLNGASQVILDEVRPTGRWINIETPFSKTEAGAPPPISTDMAREAAKRKLAAGYGVPTVRRMWVEDSGLTHYISDDDVSWMLKEERRLSQKADAFQKSSRATEKELQELYKNDPNKLKRAEIRKHINDNMRLMREKARANGWKQAYREAARDIRLGRAALNRLPKGPKGFKDILAPATLYVEKADSPYNALKKGELLLDPEKFNHFLLGEYGWPAISEVIAPYWDDVSQAILGTKTGEAGDLLRSILEKSREGKTRMKLTSDEAFILQQQLPEVLHKARKTTDPHSDSITFVEALDLAKQDPNLGQAVTDIDWFRDRLTLLGQASDPVLAEIGKTSKSVLEATKSLHYLKDHFDDEFYWIGRFADKEARKVHKTMRTKYRREALYDFVDGEGRELRGGHTRLHGFWKDAHSQMRGDPRLKTMVDDLRDVEETLKQYNGDIVKIDATISKKQQEVGRLVELDKKYQRELGMPTWLGPQTGTKRQKKITELKKEINDLKDDRHNALLKANGVSDQDRRIAGIFIRGNPLIALSRMAVPQGGNMGQVKAMQFYRFAYKMIQENAPTYRHFVREMSDYTGKIERAVPKSETFFPASAARIETKVAFRHVPEYGGGGYITAGTPRESTTIPVRELSLGAQAASQAAIQYRMNRLLRRAVGGIFSPDDAKNLRNFLGNKFQEITDPALQLRAGQKLKQEVGKGIQGEYLAPKGATTFQKESPPFSQINRVLVSQGIPYSQSYVRGAKASRKDKTRLVDLVQTGMDESGRPFYTMNAIAQEIDNSMAPVTKELHDDFKQARGIDDIISLGRKWEYNRLWRTSIVTGLINPRPTYFYNNFIGDFSQIWYEHGLGQASKTSFQLLLGMPSWSTKLFKIQSEIEKSIQKNIPGMLRTPVLGSITNALINPAAQKVWHNPKGVIITDHGQILPNKRVTDSMIEQGILDTVVREDLLSHFHTIIETKLPNRLLKAMGNWRDDISWFATYVQQRQRANLYMDMLQKGNTPQEAAKLTKDALYDWKHALTDFELRYWFGKWIPFYRFYKLAMKQAMTAITEPMTRPDKAFIDAVTGKSKLKRIHQQYTFRDTVPLVSDPGVGGEYKDEQQRMDELARYMVSDWTRPRGFIQARRTDEAEKAHYKNIHGKPYQYLGYMMPRMTLLDASDLWNAFGVGLTGTFIKIAAVANPDLNQLLAPDWEERFWSPTLDAVYPTHKIGLEQTLKNITGLDTGGSHISKETRLTPYENKLFTLLGLDVAQREHDNAPVYHSEVVILFRSILPVIPNEIGGLLNPLILDNPHARRAFDKVIDPKTGKIDKAGQASHSAHHAYKGFKWFMGAYSGVMKPYPIETPALLPSDTLSGPQQHRVGAIGAAEMQKREELSIAERKRGTELPFGLALERSRWGDITADYADRQEIARLRAVVEEARLKDEKAKKAKKVKKEE
tara:strand:- start:1957 stop:9654 length:7698 start_codon:yes stop_codon:yes gene_type:complete